MKAVGEGWSKPGSPRQQPRPPAGPPAESTCVPAAAASCGVCTAPLSQPWGPTGTVGGRHTPPAAADGVQHHLAPLLSLLKTQ